MLAREKPDFLQIDYSLDDREAEERLLPLAAEVRAGGADRAAVRPRPPVPRRARQSASAMGAGVRRRDLGAVPPQIPAWQPGGDAVIPGTADAGHMNDNLGAMRGRLPDAAQRKRMVEFLQSL